MDRKVALRTSLVPVHARNNSRRPEALCGQTDDCENRCPTTPLIVCLNRARLLAASQASLPASQATGQPLRCHRRCRKVRSISRMRLEAAERLLNPSNFRSNKSRSAWSPAVSASAMSCSIGTGFPSRPRTVSPMEGLPGLSMPS